MFKTKIAFLTAALTLGAMGATGVATADAQGYVRLYNSTNSTLETEQQFNLMVDGNGQVIVEQGPFEILPYVYGPTEGCAMIIAHCNVSHDPTDENNQNVETWWPELLKTEVSSAVTTAALSGTHTGSAWLGSYSYLPSWLLTDLATHVTNSSATATTVLELGNQLPATTVQFMDGYYAQQIWQPTTIWNTTNPWYHSTLTGSSNFDVAYIARAAIARQLNASRSTSFTPYSGPVTEAFLAAANAGNLEIQLQTLIFKDPNPTLGPGLPSLPNLPTATLSQPVVVSIIPPQIGEPGYPSWVLRVSDHTVTPTPGNPGRPYYWPVPDGTTDFYFLLDEDYHQDMVAFFSGAPSTPVSLSQMTGRLVKATLPSGAQTGPFVVMKDSQFVAILSPESDQIPSVYQPCAYGEFVIMVD